MESHRFHTGWCVAFAMVAAGSSAAAGGSPAPTGAVAQIVGMDGFPGTQVERARLERDGFVVLPRFQREIFSPYIGSSLPHFVTVDSAHRTFHVLFEATLMETERRRAVDLRELGERLTRSLEKEVRLVPAELREAAALALGYVAVGARLSGAKVALPEPIEQAVAAECLQIEQATGVGASAIFARAEDYSAYRPRGFYEGDPVLSRYFRAATWFGRPGLRVEERRETAAALLLVRALDQDPRARGIHVRLERWLETLLGRSDDLTVGEYLAAARGAPGVARQLDAVQARLRALRDPEINADLLEAPAWRRFRDETKGLRLLPARRTPDAWLFQALNEATLWRPLPSGLDVAAAMGCERPAEHLAASGEQGAAASVRDRTLGPELRRRMDGTLYGAMLEMAASLCRPQPTAAVPPAGFDGGAQPSLAAGTDAPRLPPAFFSTAPWRDRMLSASLAVWASQRHAWVLHAKANVSWLGAISGSEKPPHVVEPTPEFYASLARFARQLLAAGRSEGLFASHDLRQAGKQLLAAVVVLQRANRAGEQPSPSDQTLLSPHRERIERLIEPDHDRDAAWPAALSAAKAAAKEVHDWADYATAMDSAAWRPCRDANDAALGRLAGRLRAWLSGRSALQPREQSALLRVVASPLEAKLDELAELMDRLAGVAERQLRGEVLTEGQALMLEHYGETIARLNFYEGNSWLHPEGQTGLIVDVATAPKHGQILEAGVGAPMELYLVLPLRSGRRALYRGAVYSYYEFNRALAAGRLTDSEWQREVSDRTAPPLPSWTASYIATPSLEAILAQLGRGERVEAVGNLRDDRIADALLALVRQAGAAPPADLKARDAVAVWAAQELALYGRGPRRAAIAGALLAAVVTAPRSASMADGGALELRLPTEAAQVLGAVLGSDDCTAPLAQVRRPTGSIDERVRSDLIGALSRSRCREVAAAAERMLAEETDATVGIAALGLLFSTRWATRAFTDSPEQRPDAPESAAIARVGAAMLAVARDNRQPEVQARALFYLNALAPQVPPAAADLAALLVAADGDPSVRTEAAELLSKVAEPRHGPSLLAALSDPSERVRHSAIEGLGQSYSGGGDPKLAAAAVRRLAELVGDDPDADRHTTRECFLALSRIAGEPAMRTLVGFATGLTMQPWLRRQLVRAIAQRGKASIPYLLRFAADETATGNMMSVPNESEYHPERICDVAGEELDRLGAFQYPAEEATTAERDRALAKIRARIRRP